MSDEFYRPDGAGPTAVLAGAFDEIAVEISRKLIRENYKIIIFTDNNEERQLFSEFDGVRVVVQANKNAAELIQEACASAGSINSLINCLSVGTKVRDGESEAVQEGIDRSIDLIRAVGSIMSAGGGGAIVNVLTQSARYRSAYFKVQRPHALDDSILSGAMFAATRQLALELGPARVRVNAVAAGWVRTKQGEEAWGRLTEREREFLLEEISVGRLGEPSEVAAAAAFLASPRASYLTGTIVDVNGGWWMS